MVTFHNQSSDNAMDSFEHYNVHQNRLGFGRKDGVDFGRHLRWKRVRVTEDKVDLKVSVKRSNMLISAGLELEWPDIDKSVYVDVAVSLYKTGVRSYLRSCTGMSINSKEIYIPWAAAKSIPRHPYG